MQNFVTSAQAAKILGLSLPGVHYRIKKGYLHSKKVNGKILVNINDTVQVPKKDISNNSNQTHKINIDSQNNNTIENNANQENLIALKKIVKLLKKQYKSSKRFKKDLFDIKQLIQNNDNNIAVNEVNEYLNLEDAMIYLQTKNKSDEKIKTILLNNLLIGTKGFRYDKENNTVSIAIKALKKLFQD
jgi:hypothetical protein